MPIAYLIDSIVKNLGDPYRAIFQQHLIKDFLFIFDNSKDDMKSKLYKLRLTWDPYYSLIKLYELDDTIQKTRDANWPIKKLPAHIQKQLENSNSVPKNSASYSPGGGMSMSDGYSTAVPKVNPSEQIKRDLEKQREKLKLEMELDRARAEVKKLKQEKLCSSRNYVKHFNIKK